MVCVETPLPEIFTVSILDIIVGLADNTSVTTMVSEPDVRLGVSHGWLFVMFHPVFEYMVNVAMLLIVAAVESVFVETVRYGFSSPLKADKDCLNIPLPPVNTYELLIPILFT